VSPIQILRATTRGAQIRAALRYLLKGAAGSDRGDIVGEIIDMVGELRAACRLDSRPCWTMICPVADLYRSRGVC
jgi:hypothetical protein